MPADAVLSRRRSEERCGVRAERDAAHSRALAHVNRIRYPLPNRLGLITPTPWIETIAGRVMEENRC